MMPSPAHASLIRADDDTVIELYPDRWKVVHAHNGALGRTVFDVGLGGEVVYAAEFASARKLPSGGLPEGAITQVVLGWSPALGAWQLGVLFTPDLAAQRGSRWLELARWHDPKAVVFGTEANRAGSALARVLRLPFRVIPPALGEADDAPAPVAKPLPALPQAFGDWLAEPHPDGVALVRLPTWARARVVRAAWYAVLLFAFTGVSVLSLTVELGLPTAGTLLPVPQLLPYLGLLVSVVLAWLMAKNLLALRAMPDRVLFSSAAREVVATRGELTLWRKPEAEVAGVYVSEVAHQRRDTRTFQYIELNLLLADNRFFTVLTSEAEHSVTVRAELPEVGVVMLTSDTQHTPAQAAALHAAQALGEVTCYLDVRRG
jgi:hypothetical protein